MKVKREIIPSCKTELDQLARSSHQLGSSSRRGDNAVGHRQIESPAGWDLWPIAKRLKVNAKADPFLSVTVRPAGFFCA